MKTQTIEIAGRRIGLGEPPYIVAEMSANHLGDLRRAFAILEAARDAGVDAVKMQTYTADTITLDHDGPEFLIHGGLWDGRRLHELYQEAHTPWDWHEALFAKAKELGLVLFSSPFDETAIDLLESLDAPAYKIASFELVDIPLIQRAAASGKPVIMSTGMADLGEIETAVRAAREAGCEQLLLLHCVSGYPTPVEDSNLLTLPHLAQAFGCPVGLSDHTPGTAVAVAAVALGAAMVEKHFTLRRADGGPDAAFSLEPEELADLTRNCRAAHAALGCVNYARAPSEQRSAAFRRSLYVTKPIRAGESLSADNVRSVRPANGLPPKFLPEVLGRRARVDLAAGTPLAWHLLD